MDVFLPPIDTDGRCLGETVAAESLDPEIREAAAAADLPAPVTLDRAVSMQQVCLPERQISRPGIGDKTEVRQGEGGPSLARVTARIAERVRIGHTRGILVTIFEHGAAISQVDREEVFYLMSRGLPEVVAEQMIVTGFFQPVLDRIPMDSVRSRLEASFAAKMGLVEG